MASAGSKTFNLLTEYKVAEEDSTYLFKNSSTGSRHGVWHISRTGETTSRCGNLDYTPQPNQNTKLKYEVEDDMSKEDVKELVGIGKICSKCLYVWKKSL